MTLFSNQLLKWYRLNFRQLPWRETIDPYKIWVSEVILQQTRVAQGLGYYERIIRRFPTVSDMAKADVSELLKLWQGLGYYSRARNMHHTAIEVVRLYKGNFPSSYDELIQLKGIGEYTASAISSFVNNEPYPVLDGNVFRVISRIFGIEAPVDTNAGKKIFKEKAKEIFNAKNAGQHNQAIMEFGALVCTPKKPQCLNCIFQSRCTAHATGKIGELPVKSKKTAVRKRYLHYLVIHNGKKVILKKRTEKDIWNGLWDFPLTESKTPRLNLPMLLRNSVAVKNKIVNKPDELIKTIHKLSHQELHISFLIYKLKNPAGDKRSKCFFLKKDTLPGVPQVILRLLEDEKLLR